MAEAKIVTLYNEGGEAIAPRTGAAAVSMASGETVEAAMASVNAALANKMDKSGGAFTGVASATTARRSISYGAGELVNTGIRDSSGNAVQTIFVVMTRK